MSIKPPLGVYPKELYERVLDMDIKFNGGMEIRYILKARIDVLQGAIKRYIEAGFFIKPEWVEEYNHKLITYNEITKSYKKNSPKE